MLSSKFLYVSEKNTTLHGPGVGHASVGVGVMDIPATLSKSEFLTNQTLNLKGYYNHYAIDIQHTFSDPADPVLGVRAVGGSPLA